MRAILRKLLRGQALGEEEYTQLMQYAEGLGTTSPQSYELFYERYAATLSRDYNTYLPRFHYGIDDLFDYLLAKESLLKELQSGPISINKFPAYLYEYLHATYGDFLEASAVLPTLEFILAENTKSFELPQPRIAPLTCKYESGNPYKEIGLKSHFDRLARYSFISRLQSIRYLRGSKANEDRFELVSADCLGGIFTNKEKSIYYYIFLTEKDKEKALNACRVLNRAFFGSYGNQ